jgi:hypothetical protein
MVCPESFTWRAAYSAGDLQGMEPNSLPHYGSGMNGVEYRL